MSQDDRAAALLAEFKRLRRGRGVQRDRLDIHVGPLLREQAGIQDGARPHEVVDLLIAYLGQAAESLPADLDLALRVGLGLHPGAQFPFFDDRMDWLAEQIDRNSRTARRRFDEATRLIVARGGHPGQRPSRPARRDDAGGAVTYQEVHLYRLRALTAGTDVRVGFITGDIRRVKSADIWVNSENTSMEMSRFEEHSVSAVIRYLAARRDETGHVLADLVADELDRKMTGRGQVAPGTPIVTVAGHLLESNGVRYVVHVAAVQGEPGAGYRQVHDIGTCVSRALDAASRLSGAEPDLSTILFPILGTGVGGAEPTSTLRTLLGAAIDHLLTVGGALRTVLFLAYNAADLAACETVFAADPRITEAEATPG